MIRRITFLNVMLPMTLCLLVSGGVANAQTTSFTYQGRLQDGGTNANGSYDFQFTLWDALSGGTQQPQPSPVAVTKNSVAVANGVFTVQLDFGASAFPGADRFLESGVRLAGGGAFTVLAPRQPITSTPYALRSASSSSADVAATATNAIQLGGVAAGQYVITTDSRLSDPRTPIAGSSNYIQNGNAQQSSSNFNISGNGTAGGTLASDIVNARTQYNFNGSKLLTSPGTNLFIGFSNGVATTNVANFNTFVGTINGIQNTSGSSNSFFGYHTGFSNTQGSHNSYFGAASGYLNTTGNNNSYFGDSAGTFNVNGSNNSYFGQGTGGFGGGGSNNSYFGQGSGLNGSNNSFFGQFAGKVNGGDGNSFFGQNAGAANTDGPGNSFFGFESGNRNTSGNGNSFFGGGTGFLNTTGGVNSFFGYAAGQNNTLGSGNTFAGEYSGAANTSGSNNVFIGGSAGDGNTTEFNNTLIGYRANVAPGVNFATAIGTFAKVTQSNSLVLGSIFDGPSGALDTNVGVGTTAPIQRLHVAGNGLFTGNLGIGANSPAVALEVQRNSTIASDWQTGQLRISGASDPNMRLSLGYDTSSNLGVIQAGQAFTGFKTLSLNPSGGAVGIGTTGPDQTLTVNGGASKPGGGAWATFSDERLKNIKGRFTPGLNAVMRLQPIRYQYKPDNALGIKSEGEYIGFSAQAVQRVIPEAVTRDEKGFLLVNNDPILWTMLNAIKEQQAQIEQQRQQIEALKKLVCRSHPHATVCR